MFSFLSGLYFRGKLAYARAFVSSPAGISPIAVITAGRGLLHPDTIVRLDALRDSPRYPSMRVSRVIVSHWSAMRPRWRPVAAFWPGSAAGQHRQR